MSEQDGVTKPKPARRAVKAGASAISPAAIAFTAQAEALEASAEPAAPPAESIAPVIEAIEATVIQLTQAATSPAVTSDSIPEAGEIAPVIERIEEKMATVTATADATADKAQAMFGDMTTRFKSAFEKSSKMSEELVDFAKGNVEAVVASARVAAKAGEALGQEAADYGKKHLESATAAFKSFATVKSPTELFQLQSDYAKTSFDSAVAEASRLSESMLKFAGDIAQPLSTRYAIAAEKFKAAAL